jgi:hypothetical protein
MAAEEEMPAEEEMAAEEEMPAMPGEEAMGAPLTRAVRRAQALAERWNGLQEALRRRGEEGLLALHRVSGVTADEIAAQLDEGTAFLQYFIAGNMEERGDGTEGEERILGFVVDPQGGVRVVECGPRREVASLVLDELLPDMEEMCTLGAEFRGPHEAGLLHTTQAALRGLSELLWEPLAPLLQGYQRLIVAPHGVLHAVPFAALPLRARGGESGGRDEGAGRGTADLGDGAVAQTPCVLDRFELTIVPSGSTWVLLRGREDERSAVTGGRSAAILAAGDERAPGIEAEGAEIAALLPATVLHSGEAATCECLRRVAPASSLLHLACHGIFDQDSPMASALLLADRPLRAAELYGLRIGAQVVVLSGCETGRSRVRAGDELQGLLRGFLFAGAQAVVASLWLVDDRSSAILMHRFYSALVTGTSAGAALREAQMLVRADHPHPYHWAAYQAVGRGGVRPFHKQPQSGDGS